MRPAQDLASGAAAALVPGDQAAVGDGALREAPEPTAAGPALDVSGVAATLDAREAAQLSAMGGAPAGGDGDSAAARKREFFVMHRMHTYR